MRYSELMGSPCIERMAKSCAEKSDRLLAKGIIAHKLLIINQIDKES